ncbi:hypothetical protein ACJW30_06G165000 [Castanea mollissima]
MEEIDEARAKATASEPTNSNPNTELSEKPSKAKEEGELSSDDVDDDEDDENPVGSAAQSVGTVAPPSGPVPVFSANKGTQGILPGKVISGNSLASSIDVQSRTSLPPIPQKSFDKNRVPLKSATPGWRAPLGPDNNNLVIRFSDDDSGSDSEEYGQEKASGKGNMTVVNGNRRVPVPSLAKSNMLGKSARNINKVMPKKLSSSRTFMPSMNSIQGANSKGAGPSTVDQGSRGRNLNALNKNFGSRERGFDQSVGLNNNKLQDLRQQIALREIELKYKSALQTKESALVPYRDHNATNLSNNTARRFNATGANSLRSEPREPDKKRLKVRGSFNTQRSPAGQRDIPSANSTLPSKGPALENTSMQVRNMADCRGISSGRAESSIDKRVAVIPESIPGRAKDGADVDSGCNQSDNSRHVDSCVALIQTTPLPNVTSNILPENSSIVELSHPSKISVHQPSGSLNKATTQNNSIRSSEHREVEASDKTHESFFNSICQGSLNNASFWNYLGNANVSGHSNISLQSLDEKEESLDKDLEEAQELRRKCEIEERNALKAYRKAQKALVVANARCTDLYRRREIYSANLRSYLMQNSSLLSSSMQHEDAAMGLDPPNIMPENVNLIPTASHQMQPVFDGFDQPGCDSNIQCVDSAPTNRTHWHVNGHNLESEPCSEPDGSTSEPLTRSGKNTVDGVFSPFTDPNNSVDEDEETFPFDPESIQPNIECHIKEKNLEDGQNDISDELHKKILIDSSQDTLLLEATLRSELFARLGTRIISKDSGSCDNTESVVEEGAENDFGKDKTQIGNGPSPGVEKDGTFDLGGTDRQEGSIFEAPLENRKQSQTEKFSLKSHSTADSQDCGLSTRQVGLPASMSSSPPLILRSAFGHLKVALPNSLVKLRTRNHQSQDNNIYNEEDACVNFDEIQRSNAIANTIEDLSGREFGSYTCSPIVDPFWPLCMYELRGKCNNDECPWQHVKDYTNGKIHQQQLGDSDNADSNVGLILHRRICTGATKGPKYDYLTSPTYLVGLDMLKVDPQSYESFLAGRNGRWWQKCFSLSLAISNLRQKPFPVDGPFLHGNDNRIEIYGNWNRQSSYFQSRNRKLNQLERDVADYDQSLEMALSTLNQEDNKQEGVEKVLLLLSRALETDPTSVTLWITYLLIYYSNRNSRRKDDMFSYAVKQNEGSYELWLMYINSRMQLDDRLVAYGAALKALCHHVSASAQDGMHASSCILDLFLQMMDCLCMSGNVEKAIQRSYGLFPTTTSSDEPYPLSLSDILACLTVSDKCVFWVCCVYLVIYRKLPDGVVHRFECEKELLEIEWPVVHLIDDEKQRALALVKAAVESVDSYIYTESRKSEINLRSAQLFAVNHIRSMVALGSLECLRNLLDKYVKLYPSCLELVQISARIPNHDLGDVSFVGFEKAISNWPKEVPGIQCIWNQYVEHALRNGRFDFAEELMARWFCSVWKDNCLQNGLLEAVDGGTGNSSGSQGLVSNSNPKQIDIMFGYLNLALHKLFQNDRNEACLAIDRAMKSAIPEYFKHCLREHAIFLLTDELLSREDSPVTEIRNMLEGYLDDAHAFPIFEPLSRKFIGEIKKQRVQRLLSNILSPVSIDSSLVNSVLEMWYGPSLLPQKIGELKDLVDFVEAILEILPSNYPLAISVCKLLSRNDNSNASASVLFWASLNLVSAIFHAIPIPPECVWVEAAGILGNIAGNEAISERFYERAFSVYPFSVKLWKSYYDLSKKTTGNTSSVVDAAKEKGIELD